MPLRIVSSLNKIGMRHFKTWSVHLRDWVCGAPVFKHEIHYSLIHKKADKIKLPYYLQEQEYFSLLIIFVVWSGPQEPFVTASQVAELIDLVIIFQHFLQYSLSFSQFHVNYIILHCKLEKFWCLWYITVSLLFPLQLI